MKNRFTPLNLTLGSLFVALTAIGANITSIIPGLAVGGVPITLQTFFAVLAGLVLGSRLGAFSMFVYMMLGLVGVPVFAQFKGGPMSVLSPTFGFILSFIFIAYIAGKIIERKQTTLSYISASLIATALNYLIGTNLMYLAYMFWFEAPSGFTYKLAWIWMLPPLPKDIILAVVAGLLAYRLHRSGITKYQTSMEKNSA
ncbi:biotin transporter BioY [Ornithinibacillus gellani]|uniref:biotin transporter BioY n=1 Tax=Ornithinibacillus gellani TaxID=2293253 RepID=UPI000F463C69|nr:biotin transporter BioY [Ornithinibacillus gellani]TQS71844.1 biotin transporter BioY [Ornithinibacillus gellani]